MGSRRTPHPFPVVVEPAAACRDEIVAVLEEHGHEAGQYHVLSPDPWQVLWSHDRCGFLQFLEGKRCLLMWRSAVAASGSEHELMSQLLRYSKERRKPVVAVLVNDATCAEGVQLGMTPIWIGSETFHDLPSWSISGGRREKLRLARNHAVRLGCTWREAHPFEEPADRTALERVEERWKAARPERHTDSFQRTSFRELAEIRRYFVCEQAGHDGAVEVQAFVACTPVNVESWYLQDVVRLDHAPRGALEGAIVCALDALRDGGYKVVSNGPLPFWRPDGTPPNVHQIGPFGRWVVHFFDRQYRFRGLAQFRTKLDPDRVEPLYILLSRRVITPGVARSLVRLLTKPA